MSDEFDPVLSEIVRNYELTMNREMGRALVNLSGSFLFVSASDYACGCLDAEEREHVPRHPIGAHAVGAARSGVEIHGLRGPCGHAVECRRVLAPEEVMARRHGELRCARLHPLDQLHAEAALELANLQAHGGLREVELARGGGEAAELDDLGQRPQLIEVEAAHLKEFLIDEISKLNLPYRRFCRNARPHWRKAGRTPPRR